MVKFTLQFKVTLIQNSMETLKSYIAAIQTLTTLCLSLVYINSEALLWALLQGHLGNLKLKETVQLVYFHSFRLVSII